MAEAPQKPDEEEGAFSQRPTLSGVLLSLRDHHMVVPMVAVAEVDAVPHFSIQNELGWGLPGDCGRYPWHDIPVPLLDVEQMMLGTDKPIGLIRYVAVMHSILETTHHPFWAMPLQDIPTEVALAYANIEMHSEDPNPLVQLHVSVQGVKAFIPELVAFETLFAKKPPLKRRAKGRSSLA